MRRLGLIGGTGLDHWGVDGKLHHLDSVFGRPSAQPVEFTLGDLAVFFIPRHGSNHNIPPHAVNYRANIDAFRQLKVNGLIAINAVGGITEHNSPGSLTIPDQLIDYTWGREHSFSLSEHDALQHIEFASPFDQSLRTLLIQSSKLAVVEVNNGGCIGVTQGPRLETAAEIGRLGQDGCDMVGMTSMPEAALAREAGVAYASLCTNANWAAGIHNTPVSMEAIELTLSEAMINVRKLLDVFFKEFSNAS